MRSYLVHSAKGTSWSNHKYIKVENGKYIYKDSSNKDTNVDSEETEEDNKNKKNKNKDKTWKIHIDKNKWGKSGNKSSSKNDSSRKKDNSTKETEEVSKEEKLASEREKLENQVAIKDLKEKLKPEKTEEEIAAEQEVKDKISRAQNYISSFNATYKNTPTSKIPKERLAKYRENMAVVMSNSKKEQK